jgi:DNA-binding IclR family transcriptional regulator
MATEHDADGGTAADPHDSVLGKSVAILRAFGPEDAGLSLAELCRRTSLSRSTVHRLTGQLTALRLLDRTGDHYRLGLLVFELGMLASLERDLLAVAGPFLQELRAALGETVHLGVRDGTDVLYVAKFAGRRQVSAPSRPGGRLALHCTAVGKALLAHAGAGVLEAVCANGLEPRTPRSITAPGLLARQLEQVRATGVAFEHEESRTGLVCVASPILAEDGEVVAAVSVAGPVHRFRPNAHADQVRATARAIAAALAAARP